MVLGLTLALAAFFPVAARAQMPAPSVQTYVDQVEPDTAGQGVMPDGMIWNQPLKAGDMVLPRQSATKAKPKATFVPAVPSALNGLAAPKLPLASAKKAVPPQIKTDKNSTASLMLLQGMKTALQKGGQNTDLPKSDLEPLNPDSVKIDDSMTLSPEAVKAPLLKAPASATTLAAPMVISLPSKKEGFVAGQEPKVWGSSPDKAAAVSGSEGKLKSTTDDGMMDIVFPPEMTKDSVPTAASASGAVANDFVPTTFGSAPASAVGPVAADESLKATDMAEQPLPLEQSSAQPASDKSLFDRMAAPFTSIFGESVDEKAATKKAAQAHPSLEEDEINGETKETGAMGADKASKASDLSPLPMTESATPCKPSVTKWTRECADAGYPAHFVGKIVGETRVVCPSGDARDVWLSNNCAAPIASSPLAVSAPETDSAPMQPVTSMAHEPQSAVSVVVPEEKVSSIDASCGVANGLAADSKPAGDLCSQGQATSVLGEGPWRWSCKGMSGGVTVSCAAPVAAGASLKKVDSKESKASDAAKTAASALVDGQCGASAGVGTETVPVDALCKQGQPSRVNGVGPWTWACSGSNGGVAASCNAPRKMDGACGTSHGVGADSLPMRDLCTAGYASAVTGQGPWNWTCSGLYGGGAVMCNAPLKNNGICGAASTRGHREAPTSELCNSGAAGSVSGTGPWTWSCDGGSGGASVNCSASPLTDGACGPAHGSAYAKTPTEGLCSSGHATRVTGLGPFNWSCSGENGGATASCTASLGTKEEIESVVSCGEAVETLALGKPTEKLCASGKASDVDGVGPWTWTCADDAGHAASCSTLSASAGVCGKAANVSSTSEPKSKLCEAGTPSDVRMHAKTEWQWDCAGTMGASAVSCSAPIAAAAAAKTETLSTPKEKTPPQPSAPEAVCGSSAGKSLTEKPDDDLCSAGKASAVRGAGPWSWTCGQKAKVTCEAQKTADGLCGAANGSVQKEAPSSGLCSSGAATPVSGSGPWMWSCIGSGSGSSASCSVASQAQTKVDGLCGAASNAVINQAPVSGLCDSGMPSSVYGAGPWTWTCSGMNGGIASTCATSKVLPKAPPPPGPLVNGLCGASNGVSSLVAPEEDMCSAGMATALSGNGPWNWSCIGANGGMTVSCTAPLTPPAPIVGMCGAAHGVSTLTTPKSGLCGAGIVSAVSGKGPWTWSCSGTNGGGAVSCVAPLAGKGASTQSLPSMVTPSNGDEAPAPKAAPLGLVTPQLSSKAVLPALKPGTLPSLKSTGKIKKDASSGDMGAPLSAPALPEGTKAMTPPPVRDASLPPAGLKPPVIDSEGKTVPGTRLVLEPEASLISFERGSDKLDKDAVEVVENLIRILKAHGEARITLTAYSDTNGTITPREARRLSLNRALAIRDFMTTKGIASSRVDVRPMGANVPSGDMDRVDVKVN